MPATAKPSTSPRLAIVDAPANAKPVHGRLSVAPTFSVEAASGALLGLQLLASGREAMGWGFYIDDKTLETTLAAINARGGLLKGYLTHNHGGPNCPYWDEPEADEFASELNVAGWFSSLAIANGQLVAGRFDFFDAFKKNNAPQYDQIVEMASKTPSLLGLSIEPWGYLVYVDTAGNEYGSAPENTELLYNGMPALRVTDIWAAAFVSDGAATDGLFAKLARRVSSGFAKLTAQRSPVNNDRPSTSSGEKTTQPTVTSPTMKLIADLRAKYGADKDKLAAAMSVLGETDKPETLTVELVEAALSTKELATVRAQLTAVTTDRDTLKTQLGAKDTEIASLKSQIETLKNSGHAGGVNLGAGGGGAPVGEVNPYSEGSVNYALQAKLEKTDPTRAAALKAAAAKPAAPAAK